MSIDCRRVLRILPRNRRKHHSAVPGGPSQWSELVHRPGQCHRAVATDQPVRRPEARDATVCRGRENRTRGFGSDRERHETGGDRGAGAARRAAAPVIRIPRRLARSRERRIRLVVAHAAGELDHRELRNQDSARGAEAFDHRRVVAELLLAVRLGAPGGRIVFRGHEVLHAVRDAVERPAQLASLDLTIGLRRLGERALARDRDDGIVARPQPLEPIEEVAGELGRRGLLGSQ